jgi:predicted N-formylglutamate amidohydrolase
MSGMRAHADFIVTCEHGGNRIPARYRACFAGQEAALQSHRRFDPGALAMARELARRLGARLFPATFSRLLVDLNRSPRHPRLHAGCIRRLPVEERRKIVERHYLPLRRGVEAAIVDALDQGGRVIHFSSHSFTPELDGVVRTAAIGLLYDPARPGEAALCREWAAGLKLAAPALRVRRNYPYTGRSDGFTAWLRRRFPADAYLGIELEINQSLAGAAIPAWRQSRALVADSLLQALARLGYANSGRSRA